MVGISCQRHDNGKGARPGKASDARGTTSFETGIQWRQIGILRERHKDVRMRCINAWIITIVYSIQTAIKYVGCSYRLNSS